MYEVHFYRNRKREQPALSYLKELLGKKDKDSRIRARKIHDYINPVIARMEKGYTSPQIDTLLKVLAPLGKTLAIVPLKTRQ